MIRNLAPHFVTPIDRWNDELTTYVEHLHKTLHVDIDDPRTTFSTGYFRPYEFSQANENLATAPMHMALLLLTLLLLPALFLMHKVPRLATLTLLFIVLADFLLFSILLKWQIWNPRLIIAFPALLAPVLAWTFTAARLRFLAPLVAIALVVALVPSLNNPRRALWGPKSLFKFDRDTRRVNTVSPGAPSPALADYIVALHPQTIGIACEYNSCFDYLIQRRILDHMPKPPLFTGFNSPIHIPGKPEPDPDVLVLFPNYGFFVQHDDTHTTYRLARRFQQYSVFIRVIKPPLPSTQNSKP